MFVAINYISCTEEYKQRFEHLFSTRAKAIDRIPGFKYMEVLKPSNEKGDYLIVSHWEHEDNFKKWSTSTEFLEGHRRGFADIAEARKAGHEPPVKSVFKTYKVIAE